MDTSKQYIKMCDCEEIQGNWKPDGWDFVWDLKPTWDNSTPRLWCLLLESIADSGAYGPYVKRRQIQPKSYQGYLLWLPRQDQLQEMVQPCGFLEYLREFSNYALLLIRDEQFTSMEKLWLAFVMKEKFNKVWNGNEWIVNNN